jgi:hypothetical protein
MRLSRIVFLFSVFFLGLYACSSNDTFTIGDELVSASTDVLYNDSSTLRFYTIVQDSVKTSGTEKALVGRYSDGNFGTVTSTSFFQVTSPTYSTLNTDATFDSITLSLYSSGYTYGDTTKNFTIEVRKIKGDLSQNLDVNGYRYNVDTIEYHRDSVLAIKTFEVQPKFRRRLDITLDAEFGAKLFTMALNKNVNLTNSTYFLQYFPGIALVGNSASNPCIMSFSVDDSSYMRMYYQSGGTVSSQKYMDFKITNADYQFNHVVADRSGSPLNTLTGQEDEVISTLCNNESYCQASLGLLTKIEIPYLRNLVELDENIKILKAQLVLNAVAGTYHTVSLPTSLVLYDINTTNNELGSTVINSSGYQVTGTPLIDSEYGTDMQYTFDITYYIASMVATTSYDTPAITVILPSSLYNSTLNRAVFGDRTSSTNISKLKIWYWHY